MRLASLLVTAWITAVSVIFAVVYGRDLAVRRVRDRRKASPLAGYILALHVCIALVMGALLIDRVAGWPLAPFRAVVLAVVAMVLTYGLVLLLHYRRR